MYYSLPTKIHIDLTPENTITLTKPATATTPDEIIKQLALSDIKYAMHLEGALWLSLRSGGFVPVAFMEIPSLWKWIFLRNWYIWWLQRKHLAQAGDTVEMWLSTLAQRGVKVERNEVVSKNFGKYFFIGVGIFCIIFAIAMITVALSAVL